MNEQRRKLTAGLVALMMLLSVTAAFAYPQETAAATKTKATITVNGKKFNAEFYNNRTAKAFMTHLPATYKMKKLNGNEIYKYVGYVLPGKAKKVKKVHKGDIMLYGSDCIVIFYKTFKTSYSYTKIGRITNPKKLKSAIKKKKKARVRFKLKKPAAVTVPLTEPAQETQGEAMKAIINEKEISVDWEDNASVKELREITKTEPLRISLSMYGSFEQVGSIGRSIARDDSQMTTQPGDIVLYNGNQIVIFYGSNSWSYTRLGKIKGLSIEELKNLLGNGNVELELK